MDLSIFLQAAVDGLMISMFYVSVALGLTLMFGILRVFNFAHGEVYMIGGFITYYLFAQFQLNYFLTVIMSMIGGGIVGIILEKLIFRPFRDRPFNGFIASLGVIWILQTSVAVLCGVLDKAVPNVFPGVIRMLDVSLSAERLGAFIMSAMAVLAVYLFIQRTKTGKALRAVAQDMEAASLQGIDVNHMTSFAFALGSALAAGSGAIMSPIFLINPFIGSTPVMKSFMVIILGGMGSIPGTVLGGLILGLTESFASIYFSMGAVSVMCFAIVIIILLVKPTGLLGREE
jgi:branched-chain amino acid transport system permease protein